MDQLSAALLGSSRDTGGDLAFSALPTAPRRPDAPGPLRRSLGRRRLRTAGRREPGVAARARRHPQPAAN